jgi:hypothetical protein
LGAGRVKTRNLCWAGFETFIIVSLVTAVAEADVAISAVGHDITSGVYGSTA